MSNFASSQSVILKNVRLDFFDIFTPGKPMNPGGKAKFKVKAIIDPASEAASVAKSAMLEAATALWGANAANVVRSMTANSKALRNGNDNLNTDGSVREEYKDKLFISAGNEQRPQVIAPKKHNGKFVTITPDGRGMVDGVDVTNELGYPLTVPYRGCYVNLKVTFVAGKTFKAASGETLPNQVYGKFEALQFVRDGEAFGAGPTSAEGFDDEEVETAEAGGSDLF